MAGSHGLMGHQPIAELFSTSTQCQAAAEAATSTRTHCKANHIPNHHRRNAIHPSLRTTHPSHHTHRGIIRFNYGDRPTPRRHCRTRPLFTIRSVTAVTAS
eukprot:scaffold53205_cov21-Cyclotella_meneghiniana.AAC.1